MSDAPHQSSVPNLESLRKEAKRLLKACRAGDRAALDRLRASLPHFSVFEPPRMAEEIVLADVQQAIAREHGYANWGDLKRAGSPLEQLLHAVRGGAYAAIKSRLADFSRLADHSVHAACALGDNDALSRHLDRHPELATALHRGWPPIAYACASPLNRLSARHSAGLFECARLLLERGVDPNTSTTSESTDGSEPIPVLHRAFVTYNVPVMMLLNRHGAAEERIRQSVRRAVEQPDPWHKVFMEYMRRPGVIDEMNRTMEQWRVKQNLPPIRGHHVPEDLRELHTARIPPLPGGMADSFGTIPEEMYDRLSNWMNTKPIIHRVIRSAPPELVEFLIERGADVDARDAAGRTATALAVRAGNRPAADVLHAHGAADDDVTPVDELIGAVLALDAEKAHAIVREHPGAVEALMREEPELLGRAVAGNGVDHVRLMLEIGVDPAVTGSSGATPLHVAAWHGRVEMVKLLVQHGAAVDAVDATYRKRPVDWAMHGSQHCRTSDDEYQAVVEELSRS